MATKKKKGKGKDKKKGKSKKAKHGKGKKTEKEQKTQELLASKKAKEEREAAKNKAVQEKQEKRRLEAEATKRLARASPLVAALQKITKDEFLKKLPSANAKAAHKMCENIVTCEAEARDILSGDSEALSLDNNGFAEACALAKKELMLCEGLLATFRKHS